MKAVKYVGYHSTTSNKGKNILKSQYRKSISRTYDDQWLGDGVYFWEDCYYAVEWLIIRKIREGVILKSFIKVDSDRVLDLSSPEGNIAYNYFINSLIEKYQDTEAVKLAVEKDDDRIWMNVLEEKGFFDMFDVVIATYKKVIINEHQENEKYNFVKCIQKQICVKNLSSISETKEYDDIERIDELKDIITFNRENRS